MDVSFLRTPPKKEKKCLFLGPPHMAVFLLVFQKGVPSTKNTPGMESQRSEPIGSVVHASYMSRSFLWLFRFL